MLWKVQPTVQYIHSVFTAAEDSLHKEEYFSMLTYPSSKPEAEVEDAGVLLPLGEALVRGDHVSQEGLTN